MAKGNRGGKTGSGGGGAKGELTLPNGSKIEFEGTLNFGKADSNVTGATRAAVEAWEAKRSKNKVEYGYSLNPDGTPIGNEVRGSKGSVRVPIYYHDTEDAIFTHIHPRGDGMLGGTFSNADLRNFANFKNKTIRAAAPEGTYSISKTGKFDKAGFKQYAADADAEFRKSINAKTSSLNKDYRDGKIKYSEYTAGYAKAFNTSLVQLHEKLRAGQKTYGYEYTLEKRA